MKRLPQVVIAGFPNVGKSTLFNRLLRRKKSLVHSLPGMTRDSVSAVCVLSGKAFILTDTGGLADSSAEPLSPAVMERAWLSAKKADIILFVLDGRRELLPAEEELFWQLKKLGKPLVAVVNKVDSEAQEAKSGDFHNRLKVGSIFAVSAEHRRNLDALEDELARLLPGAPAEKELSQAIRVAIIGRINVGKSSLINRLCGEDRLITDSAPGTTRDSTDTLVVRDKKVFCLIDTAGIRKLSRTRDEREKASILKAKKNIARADVLCQVLDACEFPTRQDLAIAHLAHKSGKPLILAVNKWDLVHAGVTADGAREAISRRMSFVEYAPVIAVSALTGKRVVNILDLAEEVYTSASTRVDTPRLNDFLAWVNATHPPLTKSRRRLKIKYMTQQGIRPPTFLLFVHRPAALLPAYEKFFLQLLRKKFGFQGTPLRLRMRQS
ncbi:MAG: ribosome biogenesis GTPase Der [Clostridiales bacterium]|nr:ribosome biogenesis GTPase Der [Clostridiales bacterium]